MYAQQQVMLPPTPKKRSGGGCQCQATTALIFMMVFALAEVALFVLLTVGYFAIDSRGCCYDGPRLWNDTDIGPLAAATVEDIRSSVKTILFPCLVAAILMLIFTCLNTCMCCCSSDKVYYGLLLATGIVILAGTAVMTFLGQGAEPPMSLHLQAARTPAGTADLGKIMDLIYVVFWIILAVNGTFGLWIFLLAIFKLCAGGEKEQPEPFMPVQLAPQFGPQTPMYQTPMHQTPVQMAPRAPAATKGHPGLPAYMCV